jgi:uncharacterized membrane protein
MTRSSSRRFGERPDLSVPRGAAPRMGPHYDADAFGKFSEAIARFLGTGRFLAGQTVLVIGWIILNTIGIIQHRDRANIDRDREVAARTQADTEFLARELAAVRLALADVVTTGDLDDWLARMAKLTANGRPPPQSPATPRSLASPESLTTPDSRPGQNHIER